MNGTESTRPMPLLGDISLAFVQHIEHGLDAGFVGTRIPGLSGELQRRTGRPSHQIYLSGLLMGEEAASQLEKLQSAAAAGEELTFAADITTALDLQKVVITSFRALEDAGQPHRFFYELKLVESPPLPPPAQISGFGGLDDFGLGDLGFDTDVLGDLQDLAGEVAGAVTDALDVIDQLGALANLDGLEFGGILEPMQNVGNQVGNIAANFKKAAQSLTEAFSG